jgi:hypothetical protein
MFEEYVNCNAFNYTLTEFILEVHLTKNLIKISS